MNTQALTTKVRLAGLQPDVRTLSAPGTGNLNQFAVSIDQARQQLNTKPTDMSIADFYRQHGYKTLVHRCVRWKNAVSILKTGNLAPYGSYKGQLPGMFTWADKAFVYFDASRRQQSSPESLIHHNFYVPRDEAEDGEDVVISFVHDLSVLDNYPFYTGSSFGEPTPDTFSTVPSVPCTSPLTAKATGAEILVMPKVSNHSLTAIWVPTHRRAEFIARFRQAGIDTIDGLPLADFINPFRPLPSRLTANDRSPLLGEKLITKPATAYQHTLIYKLAGSYWPEATSLAGWARQNYSTSTGIPPVIGTTGQLKVDIMRLLPASGS